MFAGQVGLNPYEYFETITYESFRDMHSKKIALKFARVDVVKYSFFYYVTPIWDNLPVNIIQLTYSDVFFDVCKTLISVN